MKKSEKKTGKCKVCLEVGELYPRTRYCPTCYRTYKREGLRKNRERERGWLNNNNSIPGIGRAGTLYAIKEPMDRLFDLWARGRKPRDDSNGRHWL